MSTHLKQKTMAAIRRHEMLRPGDVVGVAVSGGADSVALLLLLQELREELGLQPVVIHFNHELRGAESDADERFVAELARKLGLEFIAGHENVAVRAKESHTNLEDAARKYRYEFFTACVAAGRITRVAVAHTADDQAETVLAKMIRGTGPAGLAGIYPVAEHVVRPLIEVRRAELREYLNRQGQKWREDATNADESRLRARVRARLLPALEQDFQPAIVSHLGNLASLAREDEAFWRVLVDDRFRALVRRDDSALVISTQDLLAPRGLAAAVESAHAPLHAVTTRLIRRILEELKGERAGFTSRHVEDVLHLATVSISGHRICLPSGIVVEKSFDDLRFLRADLAHEQGLSSVNWEAQFTGADSVAIPQSLDVDIPDIKLRLRLKVIDWPAGRSETKPEAVADWHQLRAPVILRNWRPGDAFRPQGHLRIHKLKSLLRERRIALHERRSWPVITSAGELIWARGFPVAHGFLAGGETKKVLVISEERF
jgi:tRNA(Ile)-lysidine synthase